MMPSLDGAAQLLHCIHSSEQLLPGHLGCKMGSCLSMQHGGASGGKVNGSHLDVGVLGQLVCAGETGRASTDDDHVGLSILIQVLEVAAGHGAAHLQVCACRHHPGSAEVSP